MGVMACSWKKTLQRKLSRLFVMRGVGRGLPLVMNKITSLISLSAGMLASSISAFAITAQEQANILFMKQEEKLARDVYQELHRTHGLQVFANIASSEQRHMESMDYLIRTYGLSDATPLESGVFTYDELNTLYAELIAKGNTSAVDALEVGVLIEEVDIEDLEAALEQTEDVTIRNVFGNLSRASRNHLRAFQNNLAAGPDTAEATPQLRFGKNARGVVCLEADAPGEAMQQQFQSRGANRKGQWQTRQPVASDGSSAEVVQMDLNCDPADPTLFRVRRSNGKQSQYSAVLSSEMVNTPWPDAAFIGKGWYATWMGDAHVGKYPQVFIERFGWITIESFEGGEVRWVNSEGRHFLSSEAHFPSVFDIENGVWL
jgi:hypothetical protein